MCVGAHTSVRSVTGVEIISTSKVQKNKTRVRWGAQTTLPPPTAKRPREKQPQATREGRPSGAKKVAQGSPLLPSFLPVLCMCCVGTDGPLQMGKD